MTGAFSPIAIWQSVFLFIAFRLRTRGHHFVDQTEFLGLIRGEEVVTLHRIFNRLEITAGMFDINLVKTLTQCQDFTGMDFDIRCLPLETAGRPGGS